MKKLKIFFNKLVHHTYLKIFIHQFSIFYYKIWGVCVAMLLWWIISVLYDNNVLSNNLIYWILSILSFISVLTVELMHEFKTFNEWSLDYRKGKYFLDKNFVNASILLLDVFTSVFIVFILGFGKDLAYYLYKNNEEYKLFISLFISWMSCSYFGSKLLFTNKFKK